MKLNQVYSLIISLGLLPVISSCQDNGATDAGSADAGSADAEPAGAAQPVAGDPASPGEDWPTWGRDSSRNMVGNAKNLPVEVNPGEMDDETEEIDLKAAKNIRWIAKLGSQSYGNVSVAHGTVSYTHLTLPTKA